MKHLTKFSILLFLVLCFSATSVIAAEPSNSATPTAVSEAETRSNVIVWRYKTINGKLYKRKYNTSTKKWIGDWVLA